MANGKVGGELGLLNLPMNLRTTLVLLGRAQHLSGPAFYSDATISSCPNREVSKTHTEQSREFFYNELNIIFTNLTTKKPLKFFYSLNRWLITPFPRYF